MPNYYLHASYKDVETYCVKINSFKSDLFNNNLDIKHLILNKNLLSIPEGAFKNMKNLESIYITKNIKRITKDAFLNCTSLKEVYYEGTEEEFNQIDVVYKSKKAVFKPGINDDVVSYIIPGNEPFINAKKYFNINLDKVDNEKRYVIVGEDVHYLLFPDSWGHCVKSQWYIDNYKTIAWMYSEIMTEQELARCLAYEFQLHTYTAWYDIIDLKEKRYLSEHEQAAIYKRNKAIYEKEERNYKEDWIWTQFKYNTQ